MVNNITIKDSLYFEFNGKRSKDFKTMNVSINSGGMQEEYFASGQKINEEETMGRNKPYFQNVKKEPLQLDVTFAKEDEWTREELREMRRWLSEPEYYVPLTFSNEPEKIYYVLYVDNPSLTHTLNSGYITITFRCNDSYAYSPVISKKYTWKSDIYNNEIIDFTSGDSNTMIVDDNGYLSLNPVKRKLNDYPSNTKLYEIG